MSNLVKNPPFLFTYWNPLSKDSNFAGSWFDYVKDVSLAKYTSESVGRYIEQTSNDQINALDATGHRICGELYDGFSGLKSQLSGINSQLSGISWHLTQVSQRLDLLLDEAKTSNLLQENIAELLRIPDSQKQRQHHIEMGLKFLNNALKEEDMYQDALRELLDAEKLLLSDYFVLHRIGMIYLYVPALGNIEKAADYFTRAGKYAFVETYPDAARLTNVLNKNVSQKFAGQAGASASDLSALAAESFFQAATSFYALGRFGDAVKIAEKAVKCQPDEAKYRFFLAKYITRTGNPSDAIPQLRRAIELVPEMALATLGDFDLNQAQPILDLLDALNNRVNAKLKLGIRCLEKCLAVNTHSGALHWTTAAQESLQNGNYSQKQTLLARLAYTYAIARFSNRGFRHYGGVVKESLKPFRGWFCKAAEQNDADALYMLADGLYDLGHRYAKGDGVPKDYTDAIKWLENWLDEAAQQNNVYAQYYLGNCYTKGVAAEKNEAEAVNWYCKAAEQNYAKAQFVLGNCYYYGRGVAKDEAEAVKWYRKAAEQNDADAHIALELFYTKGGGIEKDGLEAVKWYRKAAEQNNAAAQYNLGKCYDYGRGVAQDAVEAVKWYRKAAEQNDADAQYNLGKCYALGQGVAKDSAEAMKCYQKAAALGNLSAKRYIESVSNS